MAAILTGPAFPKPSASMGGRREIIRRKKDGEVIIEMRDRIAAADSAMSLARQRMDDEREYYTNHYTDEEYEDARAHWVESETGPDQLSPAEPLMVIPKIEGPAEEFIKKYADSNLETRFVARSRATPGENVAVMNGIMKRLDDDGNMASVESSAFREAVLYGLSAIGYRAEYAVESLDPDTKLDVGVYDQILVPIRIQRAEWTLLWDPSCERLDKSDAEWAAYRRWLTPEEYERQYPGKKLAPDGGEFETEIEGQYPRFASGDGGDPWYRKVGGEDYIAVVDYYRKVREPAAARMVKGEVKLVRGVDEDDPNPAEQEDGAEAEAKSPEGMHRPIDVARVEHIVACGDYILDRTDAPGNVIPFVPLYGREMISEDEGLHHRGLVYLLGDLAKAYENVSSQVLGFAARAVKTPIFVPEGATAADEEAWATFLTTARNYLAYSVRPPGGPSSGLAALPPPSPVPQQLQVQGQVELMRMYNEEIARLTGTLDTPSTLDSSHDRSAQSIVRLNAIGSDRHSDFIRNMELITLKRKGQLLARMIPAIYDRPGRIQWVKGDRPGDQDKPIYIRAPYTEGEDGPDLVPCPVCGGTGKLADGSADPACDGHGFAWKDNLKPILAAKDYQGKRVHYIDLREGVLDAETRIGSKEKADRAEAINTMVTLLERGIFTAEVAGDQIVAALTPDLPELGIVYERLRQQHAALHPEEDESRDAVMARLNEARREIAQRDEQIAQLQVEADRNRTVLGVAETQARSKLTSDAMKTKAALELEAVKAGAKSEETTEKGAQAFELQAMQQQFEARMAQMEAQFEMMKIAFEKGLEGGEEQAGKVADVAQGGGE